MYLHGSCAAVERSFGPIQEDDGLQIVEFRDLPVERRRVGQTVAVVLARRRILDAVRQVRVVGLRRHDA